MYPACHRGARWGKIPEADGGRTAPGPGLRGWCCGVTAGLQPKCRQLVLFVTNLQGEVVQGAPQDGVGTVVERL
jgi:hypothetical protein